MLQPLSNSADEVADELSEGEWLMSGMIDLKRLYEGFVRSYASLLLPAKKEVNSPQETHALVDYFRRLGIALGYSVLCEKQHGRRRSHDLDWCLGKEGKPIAHFEFENQSAKLSDTLEKLKESEFPIRVGYQWVPIRREADLQRGLRSLASRLSKSGSKALIIARLYPHAQGEKPGREGCDTFDYPVKAFLLRNGKVSKLRSAKLIWPRVGFLSMQFEDEVNWK